MMFSQRSILLKPVGPNYIRCSFNGWLGGQKSTYCQSQYNAGLICQAYLLGQNDEVYQDTVKSMSAIVFLATPHRGTDLAELLNRMLFVSFQSPKDFIVDLGRSSAAVEEINEQFRHIAPKLSIFSFYETLPTHVGPKRMVCGGK